MLETAKFIPSALAKSSKNIPFHKLVTILEYNSEFSLKVSRFHFSQFRDKIDEKTQNFFENIHLSFRKIDVLMPIDFVDIETNFILVKMISLNSKMIGISIVGSARKFERWLLPMLESWCLRLWENLQTDRFSVTAKFINSFKFWSNQLLIKENVEPDCYYSTISLFVAFSQYDSVPKQVQLQFTSHSSAFHFPF